MRWVTLGVPLIAAPSDVDAEILATTVYPRGHLRLSEPRSNSACIPTNLAALSLSHREPVFIQSAWHLSNAGRAGTISTVFPFLS